MWAEVCNLINSREISEEEERIIEEKRNVEEN